MQKKRLGDCSGSFTASSAIIRCCKASARTGQKHLCYYLVVLGTKQCYWSVTSSSSTVSPPVTLDMLLASYVKLLCPLFLMNPCMQFASTIAASRGCCLYVELLAMQGTFVITLYVRACALQHAHVD